MEQQEDFSKYNGEGTTLRKAQLRMLDILIEVDKICRRHNIQYWLDAGTLLGAVRHGGFIPWDDDLDISIMTKDYNKFQEICLKELPDWLSLQNEHTDPHSCMGDGLIKIRDNNSLYIHSFDNFRKKYNKGIFIDVFEYRTYSKIPSSIFYYLLKRIGRSYGFSHYNPSLTLKNVIGYFVYPIIFIFHKAILSLLNHGKPYCIGSTPERYVYGNYHRIENVFPLQEIAFENHKFMAPNNPDAFLTNEFGDYMQIPLPEKRRTHASYIFLNRRDGIVK